jgi:hypothetical protein
MAQGNTGDGADFADFHKVPALCIGGNAGSQADYVFDADADALPSFDAANGSAARRRTGASAGTTVAGQWVGK